MAALLIMWLLPLGAYVVYVILANRKKRGIARLEEVLDAPGEPDFYTAVGELMVERVESLGFFQRYLPERKVEPNFQNSYSYWHNQYLPAQRQLQKTSLSGRVYLYLNLGFLAVVVTVSLVIVKSSDRLMALLAVTLPVLAATGIVFMASLAVKRYKQAMLECYGRIDRRFCEYAAREGKGAGA